MVGRWHAMLVGEGGAWHEAALLAHAQTFLAHEPGDAVFAVAQAFAPQHLAQARGSIGASAGQERLLQLSSNERVLHAAWSLDLAHVRMVTAAADFQAVAGFAQIDIGLL